MITSLNMQAIKWLNSGNFSRVHRMRFRPGLFPDPTGGAYSAPQTPSYFNGAASKGGGERGGKGRWEGREREQEGPPLMQIPGSDRASVSA